MPHLATRRLLPTAAGALLLAATLTACGGGASGAPDDASTEDFCNAFVDGAPDEGATADDVHAYADRLTEVGTPAEISGEAREGFEAFVDYAADVSDDDVAKIDEAEDPADVFGGDDAAKVSAFSSKALQLCLGDLGDLDIPTDIPTDGLSDLPTDFPTDLPS